jgi:hypothetical protein
MWMWGGLQTLSTEIMTKPAMLADFVAALCPSDLDKAQAILCEMNIRMAHRAVVRWCGGLRVRTFGALANGGITHGVRYTTCRGADHACA